MTHLQHLTTTAAIASCWGTVILIWIAGAAHNAVKAPARLRRRRSLNLAVIAVVVAAVALVQLVPAGAWDALMLDSPWVTLLGLTLLVVSTVFALWARIALGLMWSVDTVVKQDHRLRTGGPYGITRHPIYTGLLGMLLGTVLLLGAGPAVMIVPIGLALVEMRIHTEERLMSATFPEEYSAYRQRVPQLRAGRESPATWPDWQSLKRAAREDGLVRPPCAPSGHCGRPPRRTPKPPPCRVDPAPHQISREQRTE